MPIYSKEKTMSEENKEVGGIAADRLRSLVERIERLEEEKKALSSDIRDIFAEAKSAGFDVKIMRAVIKLRKMNADELAAIPGIGPERAGALVRELAEQSDYLDELLAAVKLLHGSAASAEERPTVCFTGKMPEKRSYYEKLAEAHGYAPADDVTSHLSVLVAADVNDTSSKLKKAAKLGIRVVPLDEFLNELDKAGVPATPPEPRELPDGQLELGL